MKLLISIKDFFTHLDIKQFYKFLLFFFGGLLFLLGIVIYRHTSQVATLQKKIKRLNQQREEARALLQKNIQVIQQQQAVNEILAQDPQFNINEYFQRVVQELNLTTYNTKEPTVSSDNIDNNYTEDKLAAGFTGIDMKQLCDFLLRIEKNDRIYTKEITITKSLKTPTIDVILVIATLRERPA